MSVGRTGVILLNVGTPDAPTTSAVREYLREFLSDPRVLDMNAAGRALLLNAVILPFRPRRSAEAYRSVWTPQGSPLLVHARAFAQALAARLGDPFQVVLGMRYRLPSIGQAVEEVVRGGCDRIVLFPQFPQLASATTGTATEAAMGVIGSRWNVLPVAVVPPFYDDEGLAAAFAAVGRPVIDELRPDHVLFSFHGLPERQVARSDDTGLHCLQRPDCCDEPSPREPFCYRAQCFVTARRIAAQAGLPEGHWSVSFQSRLGRTPWIRPYTDERVNALARGGVRRLAVFCPAFVADCLETLEEIGIRARQDFARHGGEELRLVPSLNAHPRWVDAAARLVERAAGVPSARSTPLEARTML